MQTICKFLGYWVTHIQHIIGNSCEQAIRVSCDIQFSQTTPRFSSKPLHIIQWISVVCGKKNTLDSSIFCYFAKMTSFSLIYKISSSFLLIKYFNSTECIDWGYCNSSVQCFQKLKKSCELRTDFSKISLFSYFTRILSRRC